MQGIEPGERLSGRGENPPQNHNLWTPGSQKLRGNPFTPKEKTTFPPTLLRRLKTPPPVLYPVKWILVKILALFTCIYRNCVWAVWPSISEDLWIESVWSKPFRFGWWFPKGLWYCMKQGEKTDLRRCTGCRFISCCKRLALTRSLCKAIQSIPSLP